MSIGQVLLCALCMFGVLSADAAKGNYQRIWESLNRTKDQQDFFPGNRVNLTLGFSLISLSDFDPVDSSLAIGLYITHSWKDPTISWNPGRFNGIKSIRVSPNKLWIPDIVPFSFIKQEKVIDGNVVATSDGQMLYVPYFIIRTACQKAAGGRRVCPINFGSWTMDGYLLNLTNDGDLKTEDASFTSLRDSGWRYEGGKVKTSVKYYSCCPEPYPNIKVTLKIKSDDSMEDEDDEPEDEMPERRRPRKYGRRMRGYGDEEEEMPERRPRKYGRRMRGNEDEEEEMPRRRYGRNSKNSYRRRRSGCYF